MKIKIYVFAIALSLLFSMMFVAIWCEATDVKGADESLESQEFTVASDYSDTITDDEDDVFYWQVTEDGYRWQENVERPDIDIIRVSIEESDGNISVELEVKGTIQEDAQLWYVKI